MGVHQMELHDLVSGCTIFLPAIVPGPSVERFSSSSSG